MSELGPVANTLIWAKNQGRHGSPWWPALVCDAATAYMILKQPTMDGQLLVRFFGPPTVRPHLVLHQAQHDVDQRTI